MSVAKLWAKNPVFGLIPNFSEKAWFALSGQTLAGLAADGE